MSVLAAIRRYPLFAALGPDAVADWLAQGNARQVALGDDLFQAGTAGRHIYLIRSGRVRVLRSSKTGREIVLGKLGPGEIFGEYALLEPGLNTATCRMAEQGELLELPMDPLREVIARQHEIHLHLKRWLRLHAILGHFRDSSFLGFISATSLMPFIERFESARFPAERTIQTEGLCDDRWYVIVKGRVRIKALDRDSDALLGPGDFFGERTLLGRADPVAAEAESEAECLFLRREAFYRPLREGGANSLQSLQTQASRPHVIRPTYPWVEQQEATDCGLASLAMIVRYHGRNVELQEIRSQVELGPRGASIAALQTAAAALGFSTRAIRIGHEQLADVALPAIAHFAHDHYVVLFAVTPAGCIVGNPASAVQTMPIDAFRRQWSGSLLLLQPRAYA